MATLSQCKTFIATIAPLMQAEALKRGYKNVSAAIAQACLESAWGTSWISKSPYFNLYGLKCGSSWKGKAVSAKTKEEYTVGTMTTITADFRAYNSFAEGVAGYYDFISTKRYQNLKNCATPQAYADTIKADGYATDSKYPSKLMTIVNKYSLTDYDNVFDSDENPYPAPTCGSLHKGSVGVTVKWLQYELNKRGYNLTVDGSFGNKTLTAVKAYQKSAGLTVDGWVGSNTQAALKEGR